MGKKKDNGEEEKAKKKKPDKKEEKEEKEEKKGGKKKQKAEPEGKSKQAEKASKKEKEKEKKAAKQKPADAPKTAPFSPALRKPRKPGSLFPAAPEPEPLSPAVSESVPPSPAVSEPQPKPAPLSPAVREPRPVTGQYFRGGGAPYVKDAKPVTGKYFKGDSPTPHFRKKAEAPAEAPAQEPAAEENRPAPAAFSRPKSAEPRFAQQTAPAARAVPADTGKKAPAEEGKPFVSHYIKDGGADKGLFSRKKSAGQTGRAPEPAPKPEPKPESHYFKNNPRYPMPPAEAPDPNLFLQSRQAKPYDATLGDISYQGIMSYRGLMILGWLCVVVAVAEGLLNLGVKINQTIALRVGDLNSVLSYLAALALPFLVIVDYSRVLNNTDDYKKPLVRSAIPAVAIVVLSFVFMRRYMIGTVETLATDPSDALPLLTLLFQRVNDRGFITYNLFIDLFLCDLLFYFALAKPKGFVDGKRHAAFRLLAALPVGYEGVCTVVKFLAAQKKFTLPFWSFSLLTTMPPMTFLAFLAFVGVLKYLEYHYRRQVGRTEKEYTEYLQTRQSSLRFSLYLAFLFLVFTVADYVALRFLSAAFTKTAETYLVTETPVNAAEAAGFGKAFSLLFAAPIMPLYSFTRIPKNKRFIVLIPIAAAVLSVLLLLEAGYQALQMLHLDKTDLRQLIDMINLYSGGA